MIGAILLAAGRGRRLEQNEPKCLLEIEGRALLTRHVENLARAGVKALTIVVGYEQAQIRAHVAKMKERPAAFFDSAFGGKLPLEIGFIENPDYLRGSIVSLQRASNLLVQGAVYMDADVLYPAELMRRLVESKNDNCVLLDRRSEETGEEMMLGVTDGRVRAIARKVTPLGTWDLIGEAVGFAKVGKEGGAALARILDAEVAAGRLDQEYEAAMNLAFKEVRWGFEPVDDLPWTEIDFKEDVEKAKLLAAKM